jgi:hypothetical protein
MSYRLVSLGLLLNLIPMFAHADHSVRPIQAVRALEIEKNAWDVSSGERVSSGQQLRSGARIRTGADSRAILDLGKDSVVMVNPDSELSIDQSADQTWSVHLYKGGVLSAVRKSTSAKKHFFVRTQSAVMGVRGTVFFVKTEPSQRDFLCVCSGTVDVESSRGQPLGAVTATHHDHPKWINSEKSGTLGWSEAPMGSDHTDEQIKHLQALLGDGS